VGGGHGRRRPVAKPWNDAAINRARNRIGLLQYNQQRWRGSSGGKQKVRIGNGQTTTPTVHALFGKKSKHQLFWQPFLACQRESGPTTTRTADLPSFTFSRRPAPLTVMFARALVRKVPAQVTAARSISKTAVRRYVRLRFPALSPKAESPSSVLSLPEMRVFVFPFLPTFAAAATATTATTLTT
jgi:hypothetical protein